MAKRNVVIIGAAGRDFHNFNTRYRNDTSTNVVGFTAAQIPDIDVDGSLWMVLSDFVDRLKATQSDRHDGSDVRMTRRTRAITLTARQAVVTARVAP